LDGRASFARAAGAVTTCRSGCGHVSSPQGFRVTCPFFAAHPRGENRAIEGAGHASVHWRHPDVIAQAIQDLLSQLGS
jgi:hypothetical protein